MTKTIEKNSVKSRMLRDGRTVGKVEVEEEGMGEGEGKEKMRRMGYCH